MPSPLKRQRRTKAEVEAVREAAREELQRGHPMTLRQVHYRLVSRDDVKHPNTITAYKTLSGWLRDDRIAGIIPWSWMEDRLRVARQWTGYRNLEEFVGDIGYDYYRAPWQDQQHYVEVWLEKDALSSVFMDVLSDYRATLCVGRGYDGWTSIYRASMRYRAKMEQQDKGVTVLYFGDFDPSGEDMHRSLEERFARLGAHPEMPKVALTLEDAHGLPGKVEIKTDDTRAVAFVARYGDLAVELDALPVEELRQRIREQIEDRIDMEALERSREIEAEEQERLREGLDRIFGEEEKE